MHVTQRLTQSLSSFHSVCVTANAETVEANAINMNINIRLHVTSYLDLRFVGMRNEHRHKLGRSTCHIWSNVTGIVVYQRPSEGDEHLAFWVWHTFL